MEEMYRSVPSILRKFVSLVKVVDKRLHANSLRFSGFLGLRSGDARWWSGTGGQCGLGNIFYPVAAKAVTVVTPGRGATSTACPTGLGPVVGEGHLAMGCPSSTRALEFRR